MFLKLTLWGFGLQSPLNQLQGVRHFFLLLYKRSWNEQDIEMSKGINLIAGHSENHQRKLIEGMD